MKTWQEMLKHDAGCTVVGGYDHGCTCHREEWVAAIEGLVRAGENTLSETVENETSERCYFCGSGEHKEYCWIGELKNAIDRLNALAEASRKDGE